MTMPNRLTDGNIVYAKTPFGEVKIIVSDKVPKDEGWICESGPDAAAAYLFGLLANKADETK